MSSGRLALISAAVVTEFGNTTLPEAYTIERARVPEKSVPDLATLAAEDKCCVMVVGRPDFKVEKDARGGRHYEFTVDVGIQRYVASQAEEDRVEYFTERVCDYFIPSVGAIALTDFPAGIVTRLEVVAYKWDKLAGQAVFMSLISLVVEVDE